MFDIFGLFFNDRTFDHNLFFKATINCSEFDRLIFSIIHGDDRALIMPSEFNNKFGIEVSLRCMNN